MPAEEAGRVLAALTEGGWLADGAAVVLERAARGPDTPWPQGCRTVSVKRYGETRIELATC